MNTDIQSIQKEMCKILGEKEDVSYLTAELVAEATKASSPEVALRGVRWEVEGSSLTPIPGGYKWHPGCDATKWLQWTNGPITTTRLVNCANGLVKYRIKG